MDNSARWNYYYSLLEEYYKKHKNIKVPEVYKINGSRLGVWLNEQKAAYAGNGDIELTKEQIEKLEKLGIEWDFQMDPWEKKYHLLEEYYKVHGNIDVPRSYEVNGVRLGVWLNNQKAACAGHGDMKLTKEQIEKLERLGIKWDVRRISWEEKYHLLEEYYKVHGNIDIPQSYEVNGVRLGYWLMTQRKTYKGINDCILTSEQIGKLEKLGIKWDVRRISWEEEYHLLEEYYKVHGNIDIPQSYEVNGIKLGIWLRNQRQAYTGRGAHKIIPEQIKLLNSLDIDWEPIETKKLNDTITNMEIYNASLLHRMNYVLKDIKLEGLNMINSKEEQKEIEKVILKRLFK